MHNKFSHLSSEELTILHETPMFVSLLIAAADNEIDFKETEWAEKVTFFRIKTAHHSLRDFYANAHNVIKESMALNLDMLPDAYDARMHYLSDKVARINAILPKLDENTKDRMLESFQSLALSIAEISGGMFSFFSHNPDEEKWLHLPMITA